MPLIVQRLFTNVFLEISINTGNEFTGICEGYGLKQMKIIDIIESFEQMRPAGIGILAEKSYSESEIPKYFYVTLDTRNKGFNEDALAKKTLPGVVGISASRDNVFQWLGVARDLLIKMPSKDFLKLNKVTRIMYEKPEYLLQDNMKALMRIYDGDRERTLSNLLEEIMRTMILSFNKNVEIIGEKWKYSGIDQCIYRAMVKIVKGHRISSIVDLRRAIARAIKDGSNYNFYEDENKEWAQKFIDLGNSLVDELIRKTLKRIGDRYQDESEWVIKGDSMRIPDGSYFFLLGPSREHPEYAEWKKMGGPKDIMKIKEIFDIYGLQAYIDFKEKEALLRKHFDRVSIVNKNGLENARSRRYDNP
jgi:hypothetical protein